MKRSYELEPVRNTTDKRRFPSPSSTLYSPSRVAAESQVNGMSGYFGTVYLLFFFISIYPALFCLFPLPFISFSPPLDFSAFACHSFAHCPSLHVFASALAFSPLCFRFAFFNSLLPAPVLRTVLLSFARQRLALRLRT